MPAYATTWDYRQYGAVAGLEDSTSGKDSDAMIALALEEASRYVELYSRRTFGPQLTTIRPDAATEEVEHPIAAAARTFYGRGTPSLRVDACFGTLEVGDVAASDYRAVATRDETMSFYVLVRTDNDVWRDGTGYTLTATFGCAETPPAIKHCVLEFAAIRRLESRRAFGAPNVDEGDNMLSPEARRILGKYLREYRLVQF